MLTLRHHFYFLIKLLFQILSTNINHSSKFLDSHVSAIDVAFEHHAKATFSQLITSI